MGTLAAFLLATPIFGFSLELDASVTAMPFAAQAPVAASLTQREGGDDEDAAGEENSAAEDDSAAEESAADADAAPSTAELMQQRGRITPIHKWMGVATWASMTATVFLGWIQWYNLYGFFSSASDNPCVDGHAVFGQGQCSGTPVPHLVSSILTTALYSVTFGLSYRMPDPMGLDEGDSDYAKNLRRHKRLRWVHLVGMIAQIGLGVVVANASRLGLDRTNDYGTLQALSTVHMGIGLVTYAALTWAGTIFLF